MCWPVSLEEHLYQHTELVLCVMYYMPNVKNITLNAILFYRSIGLKYSFDYENISTFLYFMEVAINLF